MVEKKKKELPKVHRTDMVFKDQGKAQRKGIEIRRDTGKRVIIKKLKAGYTLYTSEKRYK